VNPKWRRLHNEELRALYSSANKIRVIRRRNKERGTCKKHEKSKCVRTCTGQGPVTASCEHGNEPSGSM